jgi:glycosyltransferase involved in cell wall biosynthesis
MNEQKLEVTLVIPVHNEQGNLAQIVEDIRTVFDGWIYEMVFIDDGSVDETAAELRELKKTIHFSGDCHPCRTIWKKRRPGDRRTSRALSLACESIGSTNVTPPHRAFRMPNCFFARLCNEENIVRMNICRTSRTSPES